MPGVGLHRAGVHLHCHLVGDSVHELLHQNADQCGSEGYPSGSVQTFTLQHPEYFIYSVPSYHHSYPEQCQADGGGGQGLIFSVAVVMVGISRFRADSDECQDYQIGQEVAQGVHGVRYHRRRMSQDTGREFENEEQYVHDASENRDTVNLLFAFHGIPSVRVANISLFLRKSL